MKTFEYKGFDASGAACRGLIEALDLKEAREKLSARGVLPERVETAGEGRAGRRRWRPAFSTESRAMIYRELSALLRAGLPFASALDILIASPEIGESGPALAGLRDRVREGARIASALQAVSPNVTLFETALVEAGERTGTLETVLGRIADFLEHQQRTSEKIQTALIYPSLVFCVAVIVAVLMMGVMVPRVGRLLGETNIRMPMITRISMSIGRLVVPLGLPLAAAAAGFGWWAVRRARAQPQAREAWEKRLFRLPLAGRCWSALIGMRFSRTLGLLLGGGVPLVEAVSLAGRATGSRWVARLTEEAANSIRHGRNLADAVRGVPPLSESLPAWMQAGEASGNLQELLNNAADRFQQQWDRLLTRTVGLLEPILILAVGAFVLFVALSILLPILTLNQTLL